MKKKWTGERLETFIISRDSFEHLHRYALVNKYITNKVVLDIASGEGYGSNLMSQNALKVYGVDIDVDTVNKAKIKYSRNNLEYIYGSATKIPLENNSIDVVVSFETIEHHDKHEEMMQEIKRVLKHNGLLIISTPDKAIYSDKQGFKNEFHIKELYKNEFAALISKYYNQYQVLTQQYSDGISIIQDERNLNKISVFTGNYDYLDGKQDIDPYYLIIIASDFNFVEEILSIFNGIQMIKEVVSIDIYKSNSYKIGNFFTTPLFFLKKLIKRI